VDEPGIFAWVIAVCYQAAAPASVVSEVVSFEAMAGDGGNVGNVDVAASASAVLPFFWWGGARHGRTPRRCLLCSGWQSQGNHE